MRRVVGVELVKGGESEKELGGQPMPRVRLLYLDSRGIGCMRARSIKTRAMVSLYIPAGLELFFKLYLLLPLSL
jgi:hypothetical protein